MADTGVQKPRSRSQVIGLFLGLGAALFLQLFPHPEGLTPQGWRVASLLVLMAVWWSTEAIPIPVTSLLPLLFLPLIGGGTRAEAAAGYSNHIVILLLGGFIVALGVERWNLHKRIALNIIVRAGDRPKALVAGFMIATALLSMWISNTATTLMMVPIALSVATASGDEDGPMAIALLLGICYAASIGGAGTPIGTPTNLIAISWLQDQAGTTISFPQWMMFGLPAVALMIPFTWYIVAGRQSFPGHKGGAVGEEVRDQLKGIGNISAPEARVAMVFGVVALFWMFRVVLQNTLGDVPGFGWIINLSDMGIAIAGAIAMFLVPSGSGEKRALLNWQEAVRLPWGVLLLFGGGISLGQSVTRSGLSEWAGSQLGFLQGAPVLLIIVVVVALVIFITELTSNVATMTTLSPILGALAVAIGIAPESLLAPAAIAASCAFMLPVATAPNAIIFATDKVSITQMMRAGFLINLGGIAIIALIGSYLAPLVL